MFFLVDFFLYFFVFSCFQFVGSTEKADPLVDRIWSDPCIVAHRPSNFLRPSPQGSRPGVPMCPFNFLWDVVGNVVGDGCELGEVGSEGSANVWRESYWLLELGISTTEKDARSETMEAFGHSY